MKTLLIGNRTEDPACFDMPAAYRLGRRPFHGRVLRIGDRAALHGILGQWRKENPKRKLVVVHDSLIDNHFSFELRPEWLFDGIADELRMSERRGELPPLPKAEVLYKAQLFNLWRQVRPKAPLSSAIQPAQAALQRIDVLLAQLGVPAKFAAVHPLFDAPYDRHRNAAPKWWAEMFAAMAEKIPTVMLGAKDRTGKVPRIGKVIPLWEKGLSVMESLAVVYRSSLFAGGDTGMTHWAAVFSKPLASCRPYWDKPWLSDARRGMDTRPISFGGKIINIPLNVDPRSAGEKVLILGKELKP